MRKKLLTMLTAVLTFVGMQAQPMAGFDLEVTTPGYQELTGGTVITIPTDADANIVLMTTSGVQTADFQTQGFNIGFNFKYNNQMMNQFAIAPRGYLVLGKDEVKGKVHTANSVYQIFNATGNDNVLGYITRGKVRYDNDSELSYKVEGSTGSKKLTVQFKNIVLYTENWNGTFDKAKVSLQICLNENGNVDMYFNNFKPNDGVSLNYNDDCKIALRGTGSDLVAKDAGFNQNTITFQDKILNWRANDYPADGTLYHWIAPEECAAPANGPQNLELTPTSNSIDGTFEPTETADHYLVLIGTNPTFNATLTDGTTYAKGETIGDFTVVGYDTKNTFSTTADLNGSTTYYIHVVPTNSFCFFGPKYAVGNKATASVTTAPAKPETITVTNIELNSMTLDVTGNANNDDIIVAYTTEPLFNHIGQQLLGGTFGQPTGNLQVGDEIEGGGIVCYRGTPSSNIVCGNLEENTLYHFKAWSVNSDNVYSSTTVTTDDITAGNVTWYDKLDQQSPYDEPAGWEQSGNWLAPNGEMTINNYQGSPTSESETHFTTPWIVLGEGTNRIVFDYSSYIWGRFSNSPHIFDNDKIYLQVSTDGENFETFYTIDKDNWKQPENVNDFSTYYVTFTEHAGEKVKIRFSMDVYSTVYIIVKNIRVEQKKDCDYPINFTLVSELTYADQAGIDWTPQGEEDAWELRYKKTEDEAWSESIIAREHPFVITGLDGVTDYDVQVRARCSATSMSDWSQTFTFKSGLAVPFTYNFSENGGFPADWTMATGAIGTDLVDNTGESNWYFQKGWSGNGNARYMSSENENNDWLITSPINVGDGSFNSRLTFSIMGMTSGESTDAKLQIFMYRNDAQPTADDVILTVEKADFPGSYDDADFTTDIIGKEGIYRFAFLMTSSDGTPPAFQIYSMGIDYTCQNDVTDFIIDEYNEISAKVSWTSTADKWFVFHRVEGETTKDYTEVTEPKYEMTGLKPHTTYEIGITKMCAEGDTAKVMIFEVTTSGEVCDMPKNITVDAKKYEATLTWEGEAAQYVINYRKQGDEEWITETSTETTYTLKNLADNTIYEYQMQAQCSKLEWDVSEWTDVATFQTIEETLFPPTNITVTPTHKNATITWEGDVDDYAIDYRLSTAGATEWTTLNVEGTEYLLEELQAKSTYLLRMRSVDGDDQSLNSEVVEFTTLDIPECVTPTELTASNVTSNSVVLSWTADEKNLSWNVRYRETEASEWTEEFNLTETTLTLNDLKDNTAYLWRVQATCEDDITSKWASQQRFTTEASGINAIGITDLTVFIEGQMLNVVNPQHGLIRDISVYDNAGRLVKRFEVNTTDNVFVHLALRGNLIVKVNGTNETKTAKVIVK